MLYLKKSRKKGPLKKGFWKNLYSIALREHGKNFDKL